MGYAKAGGKRYFAGRISGDPDARTHLVDKTFLRHFGGQKAICGARAIKPRHWVPSTLGWVSCGVCIMGFDYYGGSASEAGIGDKARDAGLLRLPPRGPKP